MSRMDDLIQEATYRFRPDPELGAEIARELRAHLEDAFEAARTKGMDEAQAEDAAIRAFGDPEEVAEKLWQVNRRRMRLRAAAKWTGRLILMPAAILMAVWLCGGTPEVLVAVLLSEGRTPAPWLERLYGRWPAREDLNDEQRLALEAATQVDWQEWARGIPEQWTRLIARYPDNPVYLARCFALFNSRLYDKAPLLPSHRRLFDRAMALLDAGEKADPDNAFWNYMKAHMLMYESGAADQKVDLTFTYPSAARGDPPAAGHGMKLVFTDRSKFERGLAEYRKGTSKPFYRSYAVEFGQELLSLRRSPKTLLNEVQEIMEAAGTLLPDLAIMRNMTRGVMAYAALEIKEGNPHEAEELIRTAPVAGAQLGADSREAIDILVADAMRQIALRQGAALYDRLDKHDLATEALALARKESQQEGSYLQKPPFQGQEKFMAERAGLLGGELLSHIPLADRSIPISLGRAERFLVERAAVGILTLLYLIVVGWLSMWTTWRLWRHRKDTRGPKLYFIGWRRLAWIVGVALALPLAAYAIFTRAFAFGSAHYGLNYQPVRVALEMGAAVLVIFGLSLFLDWRASRARCRAAGVTDRKELRMSVRRSMLPVLMACFVLVGIVSQAYLRSGEARAVASLNQPGRRVFFDEMEYVTWKDYRAYLRALPDHGALMLTEARP